MVSPSCFAHAQNWSSIQHCLIDWRNGMTRCSWVCYRRPARIPGTSSLALSIGQQSLAWIIALAGGIAIAPAVSSRCTQILRDSRLKPQDDIKAKNAKLLIGYRNLELMSPALLNSITGMLKTTPSEIGNALSKRLVFGDTDWPRGTSDCSIGIGALQLNNILLV